jgi:hypothetical protein
MMPRICSTTCGDCPDEWKESRASPMIEKSLIILCIELTAVNVNIRGECLGLKCFFAICVKAFRRSL